ncbi:MAG: helix-turn-helix transcriptional regulator [Thermotogae bacterium]|nr:helix-turn-helix transcriptional regulator [Thermotogota bacterium]MCP5465081.1 helix-turn-helix transcriptional regulator [Thermotogota bacterium]
MKKEETDVCKNNVIGDIRINELRKNLPEDELLFDIAEFFKIFGDSTRIKIINALFCENELCVCDLSVIIGISQSAVSHQLRILRQSKLVKYRKEGKTVFYSLDDEHIKQIYNLAKEHITEEK